MQIQASEIASVEEAGSLDDHPVKLIRTKGGFYICVGKPRGKFQEEALAAGSHPAIVKYNVAKKYPQFQEAMMKSEAFSQADAVVEKHSHFLTDELRKSGHDIYSVQKGPDISFFVTKFDDKVAEASGYVQEDTLLINKLSADIAFSRALAGATSEKAISSGAKKLRIEVK